MIKKNILKLNIEVNQTIFAFDNSPLNFVKKDDLFSTEPTCLRHPDVLSESHSSDQGCQNNSINNLFSDDAPKNQSIN